MNVSSLSKPQLLALLDAARKHRLRDWLCILVAYWHALRAAEVTGFTRDALKDGYLTIVREKGSLKTTQPLMEHENPLLNERQALIDCVDKTPPNQPVFKMSRVHFWRLVRKHGESAGIPQHLCHPHILKHSICSHLIPVVGIDVVREWAGHKNISSTGFYVRRSPEEVAALVSKSVQL